MVPAELVQVEAISPQLRPVAERDWHRSEQGAGGEPTAHRSHGWAHAPDESPAVGGADTGHHGS